MMPIAIIALSALVPRIAISTIASKIAASSDVPTSHKCSAVRARITRATGSVALTRKILGCGGFLGASLLMAASTLLDNPVLAVVSLALASFCNDLTLPGAWSACMDVGGSYAGTLSGTMNMVGNAGGALASAVAPYILNLSNQNWNNVIYVAAGIYFIGTFFWAVVDPVTPIESDSHTGAMG